MTFIFYMVRGLLAENNRNKSGGESFKLSKVSKSFCNILRFYSSCAVKDGGRGWRMA
jgi:hypothetical protein